MKNSMGVELTESERVLMECYQNLVKVRRNALKAVAALWQIANGLDLDPGQLYHIGA